MEPLRLNMIYLGGREENKERTEGGREREGGREEEERRGGEKRRKKEGRGLAKEVPRSGVV